MTFLAYKLPKGAPQKQVWFVECDVCRAKFLGPFPNAPKPDQRATVEGAGWRYQMPHPMDTCPSCLSTSSTDPSPDHTDGSAS